MHKIFILVHSNLSYIQFVKATRAWLCTISNVLQSSHIYTFKICKNTHKRLLNHTRIKPAQQDTCCRPRKPLGTTKNLEKDQTSVVAQPCLPQPPSPSFKHQAKCSKNDPRSLFTNYNLYDHKRERISRFLEWFCTKKCLHTSLSKNIAIIVKLLRNSIGWFSN